MDCDGQRVTTAEDASRLDVDSLYRLHYDEILRYAARRTDLATATEVAAETFLIAWRHRHEQVAAPRAWLYAIARNLVISAARRQARSEHLAHELRHGTAGQTPDVAEVVTERDRAIRALAGLSEALRETLQVTAWDGLTVAEAAVVLGCAPSTIRVRLLRARRQLVEAFTESEPPVELGQQSSAGKSDHDH